MYALFGDIMPQPNPSQATSSAIVLLCIGPMQQRPTELKSGRSRILRLSRENLCARRSFV